MIDEENRLVCISALTVLIFTISMQYESYKFLDQQKVSIALNPSKRF